MSNVIVFLTDQQRWDSTGVHGNPLELTPQFDAMARQGTHCVHSFTCAPVCGPARACLQTGAYIHRHGVHRNGPGLPTGMPSLGGLFREAGYRTGYIGKWHLSTAGMEAVPQAQRGGYEDWLAANALEMTSDSYRTRMWDADDRPVDLPGYRVDAVTDAAIRYVDRHQDERFFLFVSYLEPHHQNHVDDYPPPVGYRARYEGRWIPPDLAALGGTAHQHLGGYWGMVKRLDEALGRLLDALRSLSLLDDTIVLFTSDHGCHFKTRNGEYKRSCHESSIRVPTALTGGVFRGGGRVESMVSLVDLPPTLLDACGISVPETMQGRSLVPLVRREAGAAEAWPGEMFVQVCDDHVGRAVRTRRWKYCVMASDPACRAQPGAEAYTETFLYDLQHDPHELTNLIESEAHSPVRAAMRQRLVARMTAAGESEPTIHEATTRPMGQRAVTEREAGE